MPGDLFIRAARWKVAVVSAGLHILASLRAGPSIRVVLNHAAPFGVRQKLERECMQSQLETMFERMGARVRVRETFRRNRGGIDIRSDNRGEYFDIGVEAADRVEYEVIDIRPRLKHLLLMARRVNGKQKFLSGRDERHWFVCAVPGASVSNVVSAMEALQPSEVRAAVGRKVKQTKNRLR